LEITAILKLPPTGTSKYSVVLAASLREFVVAVGFVPNAMEQTASVWTPIRQVELSKALDAALTPPIETVWLATGGIFGTGRRFPNEIDGLKCSVTYSFAIQSHPSVT
jgi:hypothetical protein